MRLLAALVAAVGPACAGDGGGGGGGGATASSARRYLEALQGGRCAEAFHLVELVADPDPAGTRLLDRRAFEEACSRHRLTSFEFRGPTAGGIVMADVRYEDGDGRVVLEEGEGRVRQRAEVLVLRPLGGPALDLHIDGIAVRPVVDGDLRLHVVPGYHTVTTAAGPWTEAFSGVAPPRVCEGICIGHHSFSVRPTLKPAAGPAATAAVDRWRADCAAHEWVCEPPMCFPFPSGGRVSISLGGGAGLHADGGAKDAWAVELPGRRTCPGKPDEDVRVVVHLPRQGDGRVHAVVA